MKKWYAQKFYQHLSIQKRSFQIEYVLAELEGYLELKDERTGIEVLGFADRLIHLLSL